MERAGDDALRFSFMRFAQIDESECRLTENVKRLLRRKRPAPPRNIFLTQADMSFELRR